MDSVGDACCILALLKMCAFLQQNLCRNMFNVPFIVCNNDAFTPKCFLVKHLFISYLHAFKHLPRKFTILFLVCHSLLISRI